tara:strand:- start:3472 stop:3912 length:441 start_codon:yes stop_codon:yes gene_type:complete
MGKSYKLKGRYNVEQVAARKRGEKLPLTLDFMPRGRTSFTIYVVAVRDHPNVTKVGRTTKARQRKYSYECWNLAAGDAITHWTEFTLNDEFVDLPALEKHILSSLDFSIYSGKEWFAAEPEDVVRVVDCLLAETGLNYEIESSNDN